MRGRGRCESDGQLSILRLIDGTATGLVGQGQGASLAAPSRANAPASRISGATFTLLECDLWGTGHGVCSANDIPHENNSRKKFEIHALLRNTELLKALFRKYCPFRNGMELI